MAALIAEAARHGGSLDWVNCGLCVDERGAGDAIAGVRRGTPGDFWQMVKDARNTLVIPTPADSGGKHEILSIIESAYRATIEEQDDTVVWLMHALKGAGAAIDVLLRGDAVNYAVRGQDASGLAFGGWRQTEPPRIEQQLSQPDGQGRDRLRARRRPRPARGIAKADLLPGVEPLQLPALAALLPRYDRVWHW